MICSNVASAKKPCDQRVEIERGAVLATPAMRGEVMPVTPIIAERSEGDWALRMRSFLG
jgi:hypothetical protein